MGTFIFILHYIIAIILLYIILFCSHETEREYGQYVMKKERLKYPLWAFLVGIVILFIPIFNIIAYITFIAGMSSSDEIYFNSFFNKKI